MTFQAATEHAVPWWGVFVFIGALTLPWAAGVPIILRMNREGS